jgi:hypothetical protein
MQFFLSVLTMPFNQQLTTPGNFEHNEELDKTIYWKLKGKVANVMVLLYKKYVFSLDPQLLYL